MTAQIVGFVSRADAGLRAPKSVSRNVTPDKGGVATHYGGPRQKAADSGSEHHVCIATWLAWQRFHMNTHGWSDIAYTGGFCNHGYAFAGRGAGVRTGANGTNAGNQNYYAAVWIGGEGQKPTQEALDALDWWINELRKNGKAGNAVKPHRSFKATACPGGPIVDHTTARDGKTNFGDSVPAPKVATPTKAEPAPESSVPTTPSQVRQIQTILQVTPDGKWGSETDARAMRLRVAAYAKRGFPKNRDADFDVRDVQTVVSTPVDGRWGPNSQGALVNWIRRFQTAINVRPDGMWGPKTDGKLLALRRKYLNKF